MKDITEKLHFLGKLAMCSKVCCYICLGLSFFMFLFLCFCLLFFCKLSAGPGLFSLIYLETIHYLFIIFALAGEGGEGRLKITQLRLFDRG